MDPRELLDIATTVFIYFVFFALFICGAVYPVVCILMVLVVRMAYKVGNLRPGDDYRYHITV